MSTVPTPRRRGQTKKYLAITAITLGCVLMAIHWSQAVAGLGLAVAIFTWLVPRGPKG